MDQETFTETIRAFKHRTPFRPFTVATVSGNRYEVDYSDALAVREGLAIFVGPGRVPVFLDHAGVSEVLHFLQHLRPPLLLLLRLSIPLLLRFTHLALLTLNPIIDRRCRLARVLLIR